MSKKQRIFDRISDLPIKTQLLLPIAFLMLVSYVILGIILFKAGASGTGAGISAVRTQGIVVMAVSFVVLSGGIANGIRVITNDLKELKSYAHSIAQGNMDFSITLHKKNEAGAAVNEFENMRSTIQKMLQDVNGEKNDILDGNLQNRIDISAYKGDYQKIVIGMNELMDSFSGIIQEVKNASQNIASSSGQINDGAQVLSQGATEQAGAIEQLSATITEIAGQVKVNADNASTVNKLAITSSQEIERGNELMNQMTAAMAKINDSSEHIGNIIKTIEDIAFQTNILALNAAVESARAGAAGKGFAVVADEVKNLAGKSSEAVRDTTVLIEDTLKAVENGTQIAQATAKSLNTIISSTKQMTDLIAGISNATKEQAVSIQQVTQGMDQISTVVQRNSATSEESAASSQELRNLAQALEQLVQKFTLAA